MRSSEKETPGAHILLPASVGEQQVEQDEGQLQAGAPARGEEEGKSSQNVPPVLAHLQQNFGVMSRVLEREVYRRGLVQSTVEEMCQVFSTVSVVLVDILRSEIEHRLLRSQMISMIYTALEASYAPDHAQMLALVIDSSFDDLYLFNAVLSPTNLDSLLQQTQEWMNTSSSRAGSSSTYNDNVRGGAQAQSYGNTSGTARPSFSEFGKDRRVDIQHQAGVDGVLPRGPAAYGDSVPAGGINQEGDAMLPAVSGGWTNPPRRHVESEREVPLHHGHNHQLRSRPPMNQFTVPQRTHAPSVGHHHHHHQVVVGTGSLGFQQQDRQQQQQDIVQTDTFPRAPVPHGLSKRPMDRLQHQQAMQGGEDAMHARGVWRGASSSPAPQQQGAPGIPQPSYNVRNNTSPLPPHTTHGQPLHHMVTPNSPTGTRILGPQRHNANQYMQLGAVGKQPLAQAAAPMASQQATTQVSNMIPNPTAVNTTGPLASPSSTQRTVIHHLHMHHHQNQHHQQHPLPHHHHHIHHHHHDLLQQQTVAPPAAVQAKHVYHNVKQDHSATPETNAIPHNAEVATSHVKPLHHHNISIHSTKAPPQTNTPSSVGGEGAHHTPIVPTHHHSIFQVQHTSSVHHHHHHHHLLQQQPYRYTSSSASAPMSVDMINEDGMNWTSKSAHSTVASAQELRCYLQDLGVQELLIDALVKTSVTKEELLSMQKNVFEERFKKTLIPPQRDFLWSVLHPGEKTLYDKDGHEMNDLRSFIHNNSIHNNMSQEVEDEGAAAKRGRPAKTALQVPQPRTSQSRQQQQHQQQQQQQQQQQHPGEGVEYRAVVWLSGVSGSDPGQIVEKVSKHGKVLQYDVLSENSDMMYFKLKDCKADFSTVRKIGNFNVEDYYRVSPRDIGDGVPQKPRVRTEEAGDDSTNKARNKPAGSGQPHHHHHQQQQQQTHSGSYMEEQEEDGDMEGSRTHRKGMRQVRGGRGRGPHHSYHAHRHNDNNGQTVCRFFSKGVCKFGSQCQFSHLTKNMGRS